jgi:hypothetical protein
MKLLDFRGLYQAPWAQRSEFRVSSKKQRIYGQSATKMAKRMTDLGVLIDAQEVNGILHKLGYVERNPDGKAKLNWLPTEKAAGLYEWHEGADNVTGAPCRWVVWYESVFKQLRDEYNPISKEAVQALRAELEALQAAHAATSKALRAAERALDRNQGRTTVLEDGLASLRSDFGALVERLSQNG